MQIDCCAFKERKLLDHTKELRPDPGLSGLLLTDSILSKKGQSGEAALCSLRGHPRPGRGDRSQGQ